MLQFSLYHNGLLFFVNKFNKRQKIISLKRLLASAKTLKSPKFSYQIDKAIRPMLYSPRIIHNPLYPN
ncbi:hypothetical protein BH10CHL1_BH10CHL1_23270 [soil metagenome]